MHKSLIKFVLFFAALFVPAANLLAQCAICTKTASQLGDKAAQGLNYGILYLAATPLLMGAFIGFRWWKKFKSGQI